MVKKIDGIQAVAFDLDGTLVDSAPGLTHAVDQALYALELPAAGEARVVTWIGNGADVLMQRALALVPGAPKLEPAPEQLSRFADVQAVSGYARESIGQLLQAKLLQGDNGRLNPKLRLTRAEAAVLMYNMYNYIYMN